MASNRARRAFSNVVANSTQPTSPLPRLLLGAAFLVFWAMASLLQVQTSEAFILRGPTVSFVPEWSVVLQPWLLVQGHLSTSMAKAVLWGWGIELIFLLCVVGYEVAHESVRASNQRLAGWFRTGMFVLIAFNGWTDFQYGQLASGGWGQLAFALITAFIVMFFGVVGLRLLESGFGDWTL